jgi:peptidyl-prolyl cis-trans isomerase C
MRKTLNPWLAAAIIHLMSAAFLRGQAPGTTATGGPLPDGRGSVTAGADATRLANTVAAVVDGESIPEIAVQRALKRVPPARQAEARPEILTFLVENALIDHYLVKIPVAIEQKEIEAKMALIQAEIKKEGSSFDKVMQDLMLTEKDLRDKIAAEIRWDKFADAQATDKALHELFDQHREMFDGTSVSARHILLTPPTDDARAGEQAKIKLAGFKKQIEEEVARGLSQLPTGSDNLAREKARAKLTEDTFASIARKESACPSKAQGGDLGYFLRAGTMVEPFAQAAFALKPYQMSDGVQTHLGYHLILATDRKPGKDVKFDDVKDEVKEVFFDRLRDLMVSRLRPRAQITINPVSKN